MHIINKHVGQGKSFATVEDAINAIDSIITNGKVSFRNGDREVINLGKETVTIRTNIREKGIKKADKNWVLTAYNELSADGTSSAINPVNQGKAALTTANSGNKGTTSSSNTQGNGPKFSITPEVRAEMDAAYLDAVRRGDAKAVQRMVMEAAKLAMPNTKVVDKKGMTIHAY